ncbi:hypothetical protein LY90DRAFT_674657 [Neocallimastix californiae]|uniref:Bromodomain associated domain-containing protein n=1 Tax=Neocallimastix californiae TaxID=1754190 RepID=A0A1Y2AUY3_9FUNG|nr:hypothetical protein LY90DRAFT_674657 [Neocallimastix californiae]|eukprot:ORY26090.1 hypothetical protein LY90DRAFT_674657 [Neocallimastix californiae]
MEEFPLNISKYCIAKLLFQAGFEKVNKSSCEVLCDILFNYIQRLGNDIKLKAEHQGRTKVNIDDITLYFDEVGIKQQDLNEFCKVWIHSKNSTSTTQNTEEKNDENNNAEEKDKNNLSKSSTDFPRLMPPEFPMKPLDLPELLASIQKKQGEDQYIPNSPIDYDSDEEGENDSNINEDEEILEDDIDKYNKDNKINDSMKIDDSVVESTKRIENENKIDSMDIEDDNNVNKENVNNINNTKSNSNSNNNNNNNKLMNTESEDNSTLVPQKRTQNPLADRYHNPKKTRKIIIPYETSVPFEESRIFSIGRSIESFCTPKPIINTNNSNDNKKQSGRHDLYKKNNNKDIKENKIKVSLSSKITLKLSHSPPPPPIPSVNLSELFHDIYTELSITDKENNDSNSYFQQPSLLTENSMESNLVKKETTIDYIKSMKIEKSKSNNTNSNNIISNIDINNTNDNNNTENMLTNTKTINNDSNLLDNNNNNYNDNNLHETNANNNNNTLEGNEKSQKEGINLSELLTLTSNKIFNTMLKSEFSADDSLFGSRRGGNIRIIDDLSESVVPAIQQQSQESIENRDKKKDESIDNNKNTNNSNGTQGNVNGNPNSNGLDSETLKDDLIPLTKYNSGNAANKIFLHNNHVNIHVHNGGTSSVSNTTHVASYTNDNNKEEHGYGHGRSNYVRGHSPSFSRNKNGSGYMNSAPSTFNASSLTSSPTLSKHSGRTITLKNQNNKEYDHDTIEKEVKPFSSKNSINITLHKKNSQEMNFEGNSNGNSNNNTLSKKKSLLNKIEYNDENEKEKEKERPVKKFSTLSLSAEPVTPTHIKFVKRQSTNTTYVNDGNDEEEFEKNNHHSSKSLELDEKDTLNTYDNADNSDDNDEKVHSPLKERNHPKVPIKLINKLKLGFGKKFDKSEISQKNPKFSKTELDDDIENERENESKNENKMKSWDKERNNYLKVENENEDSYDRNKNPLSKNTTQRSKNVITLKEYKKNSIFNKEKEKEKEKEREKEKQENVKKNNHFDKIMHEGQLTEEPESIFENKDENKNENKNENENESENESEEFEEFIEEDEKEEQEDIENFVIKSFEKESTQKSSITNNKEDESKAQIEKDIDKLFNSSGDENENENEIEEEDDEVMAMEMEMAMEMAKEEEEEEEEEREEKEKYKNINKEQKDKLNKEEEEEEEEEINLENAFNDEFNEFDDDEEEMEKDEEEDEEEKEKKEESKTTSKTKFSKGNEDQDQDQELITVPPPQEFDEGFHDDFEENFDDSDEEIIDF